MINGQDNALLGASGPVRENFSHRARSKPPDTVMAVTTVTTTSPPLKPGAST